MKKMLLIVLFCAFISVCAGCEKTNSGYTMCTYTDGSTVSIQYPKFFGNGSDIVNDFIMQKVTNFDKGWISPSDVTIDYKSAVTFQNSKIVSVIFWGSFFGKGAAHPGIILFPYNIDLATGKNINIRDMYTINADFENVFFAKAQYPSQNIVPHNYDKAGFPSALKVIKNDCLISYDYFTATDKMYPSQPGNDVVGYLTTDGLVIDYPVIFAFGSTFDVQLSFRDIQRFYKLNQNYWES
jgi:hypothetical protein